MNKSFNPNAPNAAILVATLQATGVVKHSQDQVLPPGPLVVAGSRKNHGKDVFYKIEISAEAMENVVQASKVGQIAGMLACQGQVV